MDKSLEKMSGILIVNKEKGYTSHDVVAKLRGILHTKKIGHTGTLDPDATGVLPICVGKSTKLCDLISAKRKEYIARVKLGLITDTYDLSGNILEKRHVNVNKEEIIKALDKFKGQIEQIPPMYSAIKINGKKLYELAREGKEIERKARKITIYSLELLESDLENNEFVIRVECSKGTYIRSLCKDIGDFLKCGAAMKELERTRVGIFSLEDSKSLSEVEKMVKEERKVLLEPDSLFKKLPKIKAKKEAQKLLINGNPIAFDMCEQEYIKDIDNDYIYVENEKYIDLEEDLVRMYNHENIFYGLFKADKKTKKYYVDKMLI